MIKDAIVDIATRKNEVVIVPIQVAVNEFEFQENSLVTVFGNGGV